jgi:predicted alpha/beta hydrolase family esterase
VTAARPVLFVQGAGAGVHDEWDDKLAGSLARALGAGYEVRYPRMPDEGDPSLAGWGPAVRRELAALADGAVVVGHSLGGTILAAALAERPVIPELAVIALVAAPFVGAGGWPAEEFELPGDLGHRLPKAASVHLFHGLEDEIAPPAHADLYARAVPQAQRHLLPGRDHQLNDDLREVADAIRPSSGRARPTSAGDGGRPPR